jgi:hypothetical protein
MRTARRRASTCGWKAAISTSRAFTRARLASRQGGSFGGFVKVKAQGSSIAGMTKTADGEGALVMSGGEASSLALLLTNLDLAGVVPLVIGGDRTAALYCASRRSPRTTASFDRACW